ncbi:MAG: hypothetical protein ACXVDN_20310 [Ktedonobacteraceae bacterium]
MRSSVREPLVYGITSLTPKRADPARVLALTRDQWSIEHRLHYRRDVRVAGRCLSSS